MNEEPPGPGGGDLKVRLSAVCLSAGLWTTVCEERLLLGRYFSAQGDIWLSLYFYHSCADRERGAGSKPASEARGHLAELYLQRGGPHTPPSEHPEPEPGQDVSALSCR